MLRQACGESHGQSCAERSSSSPRCPHCGPEGKSEQPEYRILLVFLIFFFPLEGKALCSPLWGPHFMVQRDNRKANLHLPSDYWGSSREGVVPPVWLQRLGLPVLPAYLGCQWATQQKVYLSLGGLTLILSLTSLVPYSNFSLRGVPGPLLTLTNLPSTFH